MEGKLEPLNLTQKKAVGQRNGHTTRSPDRTRVAFDTNRKSKANYEIFVIDTDGANLKNWTKSEKDDRNPIGHRREIRFASSPSVMATGKYMSWP